MTIKTVLVTDFVPEAMLALLAPETVNAVLGDIASGARAFWISQANKKLTRTRRDYIDGIQEVVLEDGVASVTLAGAMAMMVEDGMGPFDMRDTLLGPNVPVVSGPGQRGKRAMKGGGFFRVIPFRHQTPGTIGQGGGAPMGSQFVGLMGATGAAALGKAVHAAAKKLSPTTGMPGGPTGWGGRLPAGLAPKLKGIHSTDIYAGMVKQQKTYSAATQNTYTTFRTITTEQNGKWLHPGIQPAHIADDVQAYVEKIAPAAFEALLGSIT